MIRNIVFDMGNVLIRWEPLSYLEAYVEGEEDRYLVRDELFASVEWVQMDRGTMTPEQALESACKRLPDHLHQPCRDIVYRWHEESPSFPGMDDLIQELSEKKYKIYLLSNTSKQFYRFRENIPALRYFDGEFVSCDHGLLKPDLDIYHTFCRQFGLNAGECFFVDDLPMNIEGAMEAGMSGFDFKGDVAALRRALGEAGVDVALPETCPAG